MYWRILKTKLSLALFCGTFVGCVGSSLGVAFGYEANDGVMYSTAPAPGYYQAINESTVNLAPEDVGAYGSTWTNDDEGAVSGGSAQGVLTGGIPELEELQKQLSELQASTEKLRGDFEDEKKKNKKETKITDPFTMKLSGHVSMDSAFVTEDETARQEIGNVKNSFSLRDLRVTMKGSGYGCLDYVFGFGVNNSISIKDAYLAIKDTAYFGDVKIGNYFVESGMESVQATFDRVFVAVDETSAVFSLYRRLGVSSTYYGADKQTRLFFGTFLGPSLSSPPHNCVDNDPGLVLNTRLTAAPICIVDEDGFTREVFHVGGSSYWYLPGKESTLRVRTRGQMWNGSNPYFFDGVIALNGDSYSTSQAEVAYQYGEFAISGEGFYMNVSDGGGEAYGTTVAARCFLTPHCSRTYNKNAGRFGTVNMPDEHVFLNFKDRVIGQNWGALEAVGKWEWLETDNLHNVIPASGGNTTGTVVRTVAGANWFLNQQTFFATNWEHAWATPRKGEQKLDTAEFDTLTIQMTFRF